MVCAWSIPTSPPNSPVPGSQNHRDYLNLFTLASYELNEDNTLQLSYSYRIQRPRYRELLPFSNFSDLRALFKGNPDLNPEFTHSFEAGHLVNREYKGNFLSHAIPLLLHRCHSSIHRGGFYRYRFHLSHQPGHPGDVYGLELNLSLHPLPFWKINTNLSLFRMVMDGNFRGRDLGSRAFTGNGRFTSASLF